MKKVIYIIASLLILASCFLTIGCQEKGSKIFHVGIDEIPDMVTDSLTGPLLTFSTTKYDFGTLRIRKSPTIVVNFEFINTGTEPLVITKGDPSCSCLSAN